MNNKSKTPLNVLAGGLALLLIAAPFTVSAQNHLFWAEDVAANIAPENNVYGTNPNYVYWLGVNGATAYLNRSECSSFVTRVLKQSYAWTDTYFKNWMGSTSPTAAKYHDAIAAQNRFSEIQYIADIQAGDFIAVKYPDGSSPTGHIMIANGPALPRAATAPLVANTVQYAVEVIDSSKSGHGPEDTRLMADGSWDTGAGIGILRLYAGNDGKIAGYTWSTYKNSTYYDQTTRHAVIGRLP